MARIRSIHPGLFSDPEFAGLSSDAQMFYLGLLTEADDNGIFEWNANKLKIRLRPLKDGSVDCLLSELEAADKIDHAEINGRKYGAIRNFRRFQRPKSPKATHPITDEWRIYVGLSPEISETPPPHADPFPPNGETPPQREEGGGRREEESEPIGSGASAPDPVKDIFDQGLELLTKRGIPEKQARGVIGQWRKKSNDKRVAELIAEAIGKNVSDPIPWFAEALKPRETYEQRRIREGNAVIDDYFAGLAAKGASMTVIELLKAIQAAYPGATNEALKTFVPVFHKRFGHREGDRLQEAADEVFANFRPKFGAPFPIPADFEQYLPSITAAKAAGAADGAPIRDALEARAKRSSKLYADWLNAQGRKIKEARHMHVYGACALEVMERCRRANERTQRVILSADDIAICEMRALTSERAHRGPPAEKLSAEAWQAQIDQIRSDWTTDTPQQEAA